MGHIAELQQTLSAYLKPADLARIDDAFRLAEEAHRGQFRKSGDPYISHPIAVAEILSQWQLDAQTLIAALLHDVVEDTHVSKEEITVKFGKSVADLVDGVSKLDRLEFQTQQDAQAENFRKMLLAMARDVRVILIKLADRLHNMRTLEAVPTAKRRRIARETIEIYGPIANRLGLDSIYRELQELGEYDTKTSSWVKTPVEIREHGGAIFCDRRYKHVFTYHNGAESYYAGRAFRGRLMV